MVDKLDQQQDIVNETNSKSEEFSKLNSKGKQQVVDQILKLSGSMKSENAKINGFLATAKQIQEETKKIEDMKKLQTDFEKAMTTAENKKNRTDEEFTKAKKAEKLFEKNPETEDYANKLAALKNATKIAKIAQEAAEDDYNTINKLIGQGIGQVKELNDKTLLTEEQLKYLKNPENTGRI